MGADVGDGEVAPLGGFTVRVTGSTPAVRSTRRQNAHTSPVLGEPHEAQVPSATPWSAAGAASAKRSAARARNPK